MTTYPTLRDRLVAAGYRRDDDVEDDVLNITMQSYCPECRFKTLRLEQWKREGHRRSLVVCRICSSAADF